MIELLRSIHGIKFQMITNYFLSTILSERNSLENMFSLLLFILFLLLMLVVSVRLTDVISPSSIMCLMFLLSAIFLIPYLNIWNLTFSIEVVLVLVLGLGFAVVTDVAVKNGIVKTKSLVNCNNSLNTVAKKRLVINRTFLIIAMILCIYFLFRMYFEIRNVTGGNIASYHSRVIEANDSSDASFSILTNQGLKFLQAMAYVSLYVFLYNVVSIKDAIRRNALYLICPFLYCIRCFLSGGRLGWICILSAAIVMAWCMYQEGRGWKPVPISVYVKLIAVVLGFCIVFYLFTFIIREFGTSKSPTDYIAVFFAVPMSSFDSFLHDPIANPLGYFGQETFGRMYNSLGKLGIPFDYVSTALEYRHAGLNAAGNVYTFFRRPYSDFGLFGMIVVTVCVVGILSYLFYKGVYKKEYRKPNPWLLFYAYFFNIITLASVDNELIQIAQIGNVVTYALLYILIKYAVKQDKHESELRDDTEDTFKNLERFPIEKRFEIMGNTKYNSIDNSRV